MWVLVVIYMQAKGAWGGGSLGDHRYEYPMPNEQACLTALNTGKFLLGQKGDINDALVAFCTLSK